MNLQAKKYVLMITIACLLLGGALAVKDLEFDRKTDTPVVLENVEQKEEETVLPEVMESSEASEDPVLEAAGEEDWEWLAAQPKLYLSDTTEINELLKELKVRFPLDAERLKALSILRVGTPHQADCLGEESGRDQDPLFRVDKADCTGLVLTNAALLYAENVEQARDAMKIINYYPGKPLSFENRLHFTTERNGFSPYFEDITEQITPPGDIAAQKVIMNGFDSQGNRVIDLNWDKEVEVRYIPSSFLTAEFLKTIPPAVGVAFIRKSDVYRGLDVAHEGLLFEGHDLFYTSVILKKVVEVDFLDYLHSPDHVVFDGILVFKIKPPLEAVD
jgi:hypothetical protein